MKKYHVIGGTDEQRAAYEEIVRSWGNEISSPKDGEPGNVIAVIAIDEGGRTNAIILANGAGDNDTAEAAVIPYGHQDAVRMWTQKMYHDR